MLGALGIGALAASSLLVGALVALRITFPPRAVGLLLAFGAGALISAVSFELAAESLEVGGVGVFGVGLALGALVFYGGDRLLEQRTGRRRPHRPRSAVAGTSEGGAAVHGASAAAAAHGADGAAARGAGGAGAGGGAVLALGALLDGIPEQLALGISLAGGQSADVALLAAIFVSNLPESVGSAAELRRGGWAAGRVAGLWLVVSVVCTLATVAGYGLLDGASGEVRGAISAFAAGAVLTMLADSMVPESRKDGGRAAGLAVVLGFAAAVLLSQA